MNKTKQDFATALKELAREVRCRAKPLFEKEDLNRYLKGELSAEQEHGIQNRLALDRESTRDLLDMAERETRQENSAAVSSNHVPTWQMMKARMDQEKLFEVAQSRQRSELPARRRRLSFPWTLAALVPFFVGLGFWSSYLFEAPGLKEPGINIHFSELIPVDDSLPRSEGTIQVIKVASQAPRILFLLSLGDRGIFEDHRIEILGASGESLWSREGILSNEFGTFTLDVPRDFLPSGTYRIQLLGLGADRSEAIANYDVRLIYE